jgi:uncharacterized protein (DUF934 family)
MALIKRESVVSDDTFVLVPDDAAIPATGDVIVGLKRVLAGEGLAGRSGKLGVRVDPEDAAADVLPLLGKVALVAVNFPKFGDGRGYSTARLLRERHGYTGELRAVGEVLADQLFYLKRCGIDAFDLAPGKDVHAALRALRDFSVTYQAASDQAQPLYRRHAR